MILLRQKALFLLVITGLIGYSGGCCIAAPALDTDEAGLWMEVEKQEQFIRTSPFRIKDETLEGFLHGMVCELTLEDCNQIRVYALNLPGFNAFMMPNGAMFVQSGLLLRMTSTSELATILAHEIVHYSKKHSLENIRRWRKSNNAFAVIGAVVGAVGSVAASSAATYQDYQSALNLSNSALLMLQSAQILAGFQLIAYGRDDERESDVEGLHLLRAAGFDTLAAPSVWENYIREEAFSEENKGFSILSTHPAPESRFEYLRKTSAQTVTLPDSRSPYAEDAIFDYISLDTRKAWLADEVRALHPKQVAGLVHNQSLFAEISTGYLDYSVAKAWEIYSGRQGLTKRQINKALEQAREVYAKAARSESGMPTQAYRDWAQINEKLNYYDDAIKALEKYLAIAPDAWDAKFVARKIKKLKKNEHQADRSD